MAEDVERAKSDLLEATRQAPGDTDAALCIGTDGEICEEMVVRFTLLSALSTQNDDPQGASRPWDKDRDGFVLGDGAGVLVLEEYEFAKKRGARIYAELSGFGMSGDAYHMTQPSVGGEGAAQCMNNALTDAGLDPGDIEQRQAAQDVVFESDFVEHHGHRERHRAQARWHAEHLIVEKQHEGAEHHQHHALADLADAEALEALQDPDPDSGPGGAG